MKKETDVAHSCELRVAKCVLKEFRIAVCVVNIVYKPKHDISRGAADFFTVHAELQLVDQPRFA